jgi:hypothetical protein
LRENQNDRATTLATGHKIQTWENQGNEKYLVDLSAKEISRRESAAELPLLVDLLTLGTLTSTSRANEDDSGSLEGSRRHGFAVETNITVISNMCETITNNWNQE